MKPTKPTKPKLARSASGPDPLVSARIPPHLRDRLDAWARRRGIPRSLAIRRLLEGAIKLKP
ncbi:MAG: ribbon-helix-helix protein, CopG family [Xanthobacteraceae bacterium]|nr:ribbon-helix-helix protein, CopG family [Xanthobacteraceae bacterium]MBV9237947.1 ribbon-helix-helix protein, CopG family [Xanthobacteraceae bacterium]MBV9629623.1 ribbon-helix-helix protein, CopG family [Xanthobacteraceae bacterium]